MSLVVNACTKSMHDCDDTIITKNCHCLESLRIAIAFESLRIAIAFESLRIAIALDGLELPSDHDHAI